MNSNALWGLLFLILIIAGVAVWALAGEPVIDRQPEGAATTTENGGTEGPLTPEQLKARVVLDTPAANATVGKTFTISGKAPGPWYFEASFPVEVRSATGTVLVQTFATAQGDWMTTDDVAFTADIAVPNYTGPATLVLARDNPSGLPENDASISIPITIQ